MRNNVPHVAFFVLALITLMAMFAETVYAVGHYLLR
jgi:hypothetical protein